MTEKQDGLDNVSLFGGIIKIWIDTDSIHFKIDDRGYSIVELNSDEAREVADLLQRFASNID